MVVQGEAPCPATSDADLVDGGPLRHVPRRGVLHLDRSAAGRPPRQAVRMAPLGRGMAAHLTIRLAVNRPIKRPGDVR